MDPLAIDVDGSHGLVDPPAHVRKKYTRAYLTCLVCSKVSERLDRHLYRVCMTKNSAEERKAAIADARARVRNISSKGTSIDEDDIMSLETLANVIPFLEDRGFLIVRKPTAASTVQLEEQTAGASSTTPAVEFEVVQESEMSESVASAVHPSAQSTQVSLSREDYQRSPVHTVKLEEQTAGASSTTPAVEFEVVQESEMSKSVASAVHPSAQSTQVSLSRNCQRLPVQNEQAGPATPKPKDSPVIIDEEWEMVSVGSPVRTDPQVMDDEELGDLPVEKDSSECQSDEEDEEDEVSSGEEYTFSDEQESAISSEHESNDGSDEDLNRALKRKWTGLKLRMKKAGLYKRFADSHPVLMGFAQYLKTYVASMKKIKQEVANVLRFLYYMNNDCLHLDFVMDIQKARSFFGKLQEVGLSSQTSCNYLKNLKRFLRYQQRATNLAHEDKKLYKAYKIFDTVIKEIQTSLAKGVSKEVVSNRFDALTTTHLKPVEYLKILNVAKNSFSKSLQYIKGGSKKIYQLNVLYYLETLLVLKHGQRPGVIQNLTVSEWDRRLPYSFHGGDYIVVDVKAHKTSAQQVACFALSPTEQEWLEVYFDKIRPVLVNENSPNNFFHSTTGGAIYNVSNDITRYHTRFELPSVTSQMIRKVIESWTISRLKDSEKHLFARYLGHSNETAERNYRENTLESVCHGHTLVLRSWDEEMNEQACTSRAGLGSSPSTETLSRAGQSLKRSSSSTEGPSPSRPRMNPVVLLKRLPNL
ncbi:uncharacterized protein [Dendrobates tinctorius]|uniref:uncharacterized protein isoform X2 n=1 Tax=Dendrobates tinctorius TaxID=92724 RepID=UPI003CC9D05C